MGFFFIFSIGEIIVVVFVMIDTMNMRLIYAGLPCFFSTTGVYFFPEIIYFIFDDLLLVFEFIID